VVVLCLSWVFAHPIVLYFQNGSIHPTLASPASPVRCFFLILSTTPWKLTRSLQHFSAWCTGVHTFDTSKWQPSQPPTSLVTYHFDKTFTAQDGNAVGARLQLIPSSPCFIFLSIDSRALIRGRAKVNNKARKQWLVLASIHPMYNKSLNIPMLEHHFGPSESKSNRADTHKLVCSTLFCFKLASASKSEG